MLIAAAALAGCTGKKTADVQQETRVLTKTETAVAAPVQLAEEFTSKSNLTSRTTSRPRRRACISTGFWSRWAIPCVRVS